MCAAQVPSIPSEGYAMNDVKYMFPDRRMAYPKPLQQFWQGFAVYVVGLMSGVAAAVFWLGVAG